MLNSTQLVKNAESLLSQKLSDTIKLSETIQLQSNITSRRASEISKSIKEALEIVKKHQTTTLDKKPLSNSLPMNNKNEHDFFVEGDTYEVTLNPNLPDWQGYEKRLTYRGILHKLPTSQESGSYGGRFGPIKTIRTLEDLKNLITDKKDSTRIFPAELTLIVDKQPVKFNLFGYPFTKRDAVKSIDHIKIGGRKKRTKRYKKRKILSKKYKLN
jgi:hypothetical protein